ncbi:MAG: 3-deoxy-7-phosphoheptulonate synthase [Gammaproteobacteria bacterium]
MNTRATLIENSNVASLTPLLAPAALHARLPLEAAAAAFISTTRNAVADVLAGRDRRFMVVVGPCSIHDVRAAREYLERLAPLAAALADRLLVLMRVYFEKPRTTVGWKGLINDPHLNDSFDIESGLEIARRFLLELASANMPAATEALDPIVPQYLGDLVSWYAIGARTTESQTHREMASGLSAPCGFKNGTDGGIAVALQAMQSARAPHHFLGIDSQGRTSMVRTRGNADVHVILRGGREPNYDANVVAACVEGLRAAELPEAVMIDCSHGNSGKDPARQPDVARAAVAQRKAGQQALIGIMLESHLEGGNQPLSGDPAGLRYGVSITDACMDWATTESLLRELHAQLA